MLSVFFHGVKVGEIDIDSELVSTEPNDNGLILNFRDGSSYYVTWEKYRVFVYNAELRRIHKWRIPARVAPGKASGYFNVDGQRDKVNHLTERHTTEYSLGVDSENKKTGGVSRIASIVGHIGPRANHLPGRPGSTERYSYLLNYYRSSRYGSPFDMGDVMTQAERLPDTAEQLADELGDV